MRTFPSFARFIPLFSPFIIIGGALIILWGKTILPLLYALHWIALLFMGCLMITPYGWKRLGNAHSRPPLNIGIWLGRILLFEMLLWVLFNVLSLLYTPLLPPLTPSPELLLNSSLTFQQGLFPWALIALLAVNLGQIAYNQDRDAYYHTSLQPLIHTQATHFLGALFNHKARTATQLMIAVSLASLWLLIVKVFSPTPLVLGFTWPALFTSGILAGLLLFKSIKRTIQSRIIRHLSPGLATLCISLLSIGLIGIGNHWFTGLTLSLAPPQPPHILQPFYQLSGDYQRLIISHTWWLLWTPLIAVYLVHESQGRRVVEVIAGILLLPVLLAGLSFCGYLHADRWHQLPPIATAIMGTLSLSGLLFLLLQRSFVSAWRLLYVPARQAKYRNTAQFLLKLYRISIILLLILWPGGVWLIIIALFGISLWLMLDNYASGVCLLLRRLYRHQ